MGESQEGDINQSAWAAQNKEMWKPSMDDFRIKVVLAGVSSEYL